MASKVISEAMHRNLREVYGKTPSTVIAAHKKGKAKKKMLFAIAASKTRQKGGSVFK